MLHRAGIPAESKGHLRRESPPHARTAQSIAMQTPPPPVAVQTGRTVNPQCVGKNPTPTPDLHCATEAIECSACLGGREGIT